LAPIAEQPTPASLRRLEHEYSLAAKLDPAWAAQPLALTRHNTVRYLGVDVEDALALAEGTEV
jgi:hypothetical protein